MKIYLLLASAFCCATFPACASEGWPPAELEGTWRIFELETFNDEQVDWDGRDMLLLLIEDRLIIIDVDHDQQVAYGYVLSDPVVLENEYRVQLKLPFTDPKMDPMDCSTIFRPGEKTHGKPTLHVTIHFVGRPFKAHAGRIDQRAASELIKRHLDNPVFQCPPEIRKLMRTKFQEEK